uniref:Uncharacterized protein n=1 Tax=Helianthus annuus TaxID=4232 RepID=A0A251RMT5_HELAN
MKKKAPMLVLYQIYCRRVLQFSPLYLFNGRFCVKLTATHHQLTFSVVIASPHLKRFS